jgi:hypothetical protein
MGDETEILTQLQELKERVDTNAASIKTNASSILSNSRNILREKLERELASCEGKFRISGYVWTLANFGRTGNSVRRKFIKTLVRVAFVNTQLLTEEEAEKLPIDDCRPIVWKDDKPIEITFGDNTIFHYVKDKLSGKALAHPTIKIRIMLPKIINGMYDDCLRFRRKLLDEGDNRTLYVDYKPFEPYIFLMEKRMDEDRQVRSRVQVEWLDERYKDPVLHHDTFSFAPSTDVRGKGKRGGNRGGGRGGRGGRGQAATPGSPRNLRSRDTDGRMDEN